VIAADNGDGTVQVNIGGDPQAVTAFTLAAYTPNVGDIVEVRREAGFAVVHDTYANPATIAARTAANSPAGQQSTLLQGDTAFIDSVLVGTVPLQDTALTPDWGAAVVTTDTNGNWSFNLSVTYQVGWTGGAWSGDNTYAAFVPLTLSACTLGTMAGIAYNASGGTNTTRTITVCYSVIGA
jgi:hypothetical protein